MEGEFQEGLVREWRVKWQEKEKKAIIRCMGCEQLGVSSAAGLDVELASVVVSKV